jgi:hypothetical protein
MQLTALRDVNGIRGSNQMTVVLFARRSKRNHDVVADGAVYIAKSATTSGFGATAPHTIRA